MQPRGSRAALLSLLLLAGVAGVIPFFACANGGQPASQLGDDASTADTFVPTSDGPTGGSCDANTSTDWTNCGSCGHVCPTGNICNAGVCMAPCPSGLSACPGQTTCFDFTKDPQNCGACGTQCIAPSGGVGAASSGCVNSVCTFSCPDAGPEGGAVVRCDYDSGGAAGCFDPRSASEACGSCATQCSGTQSCVQGQCCTSGWHVCGGACTNTITDPLNCGACEAGCPSPGQCINSTCAGYAVTNPAATAFIDACSLAGHTTDLAGQTSWAVSAAATTMPFGFTFYGTSQTQAWVGTDGTLGFGTPPNVFQGGPPDCHGNNPFATYAALVAYGDSNLSTGSTTGVCTGTQGTQPNRQFVATWSKASQPFDTGSVVTFSIILSETSNAIDFVYQTAATADGGIDPVVGGSNASVGIQVPQGPTILATKVFCGNGSVGFINSTPLAIHFQPL